MPWSINSRSRCNQCLSQYFLLEFKSKLRAGANILVDTRDTARAGQNSQRTIKEAGVHEDARNSLEGQQIGNEQAANIAQNLTLQDQDQVCGSSLLYVVSNICSRFIFAAG